MKNKEKELWKAAAWGMLYLVQCGINGLVPEGKCIEAMDLEKVYLLSKSQSLEALTCMALERRRKEASLVDEKQVLARWEESKNKAIRKNMLMDAARAKLFSWLEEKKIWHMALKGAVLAPMYPGFGMRQMSDNDILFDASFRREVHDWFVEQGYTVENFQKSNHDEYQKKPIYNFELHTALFNESEQAEFTQYYLTIKERLLPISGKKYEYCMTDEDFYLYLLAHEYKHFCNNGTGLRSLVDLYVFNRKKSNLDRSYLKGELKKLDLLIFEKEMRELAEKVFVPEFNINELSEKELVMLKELLFSCTYGTTKISWKNRIRNKRFDPKRITVMEKLQYLMGRLFPDKAYMEAWCQEYEPYLYRHWWLMPVAPIWRIVRRSVEKRKQVREELKAVRKA